MASLDPTVNMSSPRHLSLPSDANNSYNEVNEFVKNELGLGDTGRMISSALSDGYLPGIGMDDTSKVMHVHVQCTASLLRTPLGPHYLSLIHVQCSLFIKDTIGPTLPVLNTCTV